MQHVSTSIPFLKSARRGALLLALGVAGPAAWGQSFGPASVYSTESTPGERSAPVGVTVGDVNGDGRPDIVTASYSSARVTLLYGQANGFAPAASYASDGFYTPILSDFNGDGRLDFVSSFFGAAVPVLYGQAGGGFPVISRYPAGGVGAGLGVAVGDMNRDGRPDIVMFDGLGVKVLLGLATGGFAPVVIYNSSAVSQAGVVRDVNGDGWLDAVSAKSGQIAVLYGQASGLAPAVTYSNGTGTSGTFIIGDVNGDGRQDIVTTDFSSTTTGAYTVLLGQPGGFASFSAYSLGTFSGLIRALGDVTGDGLPDLILTNGPLVGVLTGQVGGFSTTISTYPIGGGGRNAQDVALSDLNGDGRLDIVTANWLSYDVSVLLNTGTCMPLAATRATAAPDVALAPNPAHDAFSVTLPAGTAATRAELLNALGQVVRRPAVDGPRFTVETAGLAPGVYSLRLRTGEAVLARRVIVE
ncbi:T9SS type A sorting domain-containing protein [Hymenobacter sp. M29]|uniref:T9SS type A sorting domain-containing protein n=1 Tax=Hymenobacter mellowenesis TaxID=3063995 RepID=A0ABT9AI30_9BACT|nr:T9SS type A sorting domain-containing protein [Hymenobacter sp. M29]MDO7848989.1 T9SS type A sorting domain-containing protein [Hymenobacter sp. M29]